MANFCSKFFAKIRAVVNGVGPKLGEIIAEVTKYTKLLKDIVGSPTVDLLIKLIPQAAPVKAWLEKALPVLTGITVTAEDFYDKLKEWLDSLPTEEARNAMLVKLAAVAAKIADTEDGSDPQKEKVYDAAVLARVFADSPEAEQLEEAA